MKQGVLVVLFSVYLFGLTAQVNLVPNPSFEMHSACPDNWDQISFATGWQSCKGSPDYYNSCGAPDSFSVPSNYMGYQFADNGSAYSGIIMYDKSGFELDEILGTQLSQPLSVGVRYYVSFKVVWKYNNQFSVCCNHNKIGALFSTISYSFTNPPPQNNIAHVYDNNVVSDTTNWYKIFGSFIADSAYSFLMLGNFFDEANMVVNDLIPSNFYSYYYIDEVCVSADSVFTSNYSTEIIQRDSDSIIKIFPNPAKSYFTVQSDIVNNFQINIYDVNGNAVVLVHGYNGVQIDLRSLAQGTYCIEIITEDKVYRYKLIKSE